MLGSYTRLKLVVQVLDIGLYGRGNVAFRDIFATGGGKIEHSIFYDLWIMIYDLHFAVQRYNKKTRYARKKEKKSRRMGYVRIGRVPGGASRSANRSQERYRSAKS